MSPRLCLLTPIPLLLSSAARVPFPGKGKRDFTPLSTPSSRSLRPRALEVWITDIREHQGRLSFTIGKRETGALR